MESSVIEDACDLCQLLLRVWPAIRSLIQSDPDSTTIALDDTELRFIDPYQLQRFALIGSSRSFGEFCTMSIHKYGRQIFVPPALSPEQICESVKRDFDDERRKDDGFRIALVTENPEFCPKRVLFITNQGVTLLEDHKIEAWACLSYCWGSQEPRLELTTKALAGFKAGIPELSLPPLFIDAVTVCRWFGIEYLWIDALCIIQNDERDWRQQAAQMARIYAKSALTIAAEDALDPSTPMLRSVYHRPPWALVQESTDRSISDLCVSDTYVRRRGCEDLQKGRLQLRAWTLQEVELASFVVRFRSECIEWYTPKEHRYSHTFARPEEDSKISWRSCNPLHYSSIIGSHFGTWFDVVSGYSHRFITRSSDRLPALAALAESWSKQWNPASADCGQTGRYILGIWENSLPRGLLWQRSRDCMETRSVLRIESPSTHRPTWTWASLDYGVSWPNIWDTFLLRVDLIATSTAEIMEFQIDDCGSMWLGLHVTASISLGARYLAVDLNRFIKESREEQLVFIDPPKVRSKTFDEILAGMYCQFDDPEFLQSYQIRGQQVASGTHCLAILGYRRHQDKNDTGIRLYGLLLESKAARSVYERIAYVEVRVSDHLMINEWRAHIGEAEYLRRSEERWYEICPENMPWDPSMEWSSEHEVFDCWLQALPSGTFKLV